VDINKELRAQADYYLGKSGALDVVENQVDDLLKQAEALTAKMAADNEKAHAEGRAKADHAAASEEFLTIMARMKEVGERYLAVMRSPDVGTTEN